MKIYPWMISHIHLLEKEPSVIARYMEYPKKYITKGVIQWHLRGPKLETLTSEEKKALANASWEDIYKPKGIIKKAIEKTKGVSVHEDWRFAVNDYLVGWSVSFDSPILIRENNKVRLIPIYELYRIEESIDYKVIDFQDRNIEVWANNRWSKIRKVVVHRDRVKRLRNVVTSDGLIECTVDHSLFSPDGKSVEVASLSIGDQIKTVNVPKLPETIDINEDLAFVLGYFVADGYVSLRTKPWRQYHVGFKDSDKKKLEVIQAKLLRLGHESKIIKEESWYRLVPKHGTSLGSYLYKECYYIFRNPRKKVKTVPDIILNASLRSKEAFLRGYLMGDACQIGKDSWMMQGNNILELQGIMLIAKQLGYKYNVNVQYNKKVKKYYYTLHLYKSNAKNTNRNAIKKILERRRSRDRESDATIYVYDIETEDHSFMSGLGTVLAHNSIVGTQWGYGPEKLGPDPDKVNRGFRAETKCFSEICNEWMYDVINVDEESGIVHVKWHSKEELCEKTLEELARQPCVGKNTLVVTSSGFKEAKNVTKSDLILGKDGVFHKIKKIEKIQESGGVMVKVAYSPPMIVTKDHPFLVVRTATCPIHGDFKAGRSLSTTSHCKYCRFEVSPFMKLEWVQAKDLEKDDLVLFPRVIKPYWNTHELPSLNENEARILGLYIGDGSIHGSNSTIRIVLNYYKERKLAEYYAQLSKAIGCKYWINEWKKNGVICLNIKSQELCSKIKRIAIKNKQKAIPWWIVYYPDNIREAMFHGLIDSDGYWINGHTAFFCTSSGRIALGFWNLCRSLGYVVSMRYRENTSKLVPSAKKIFQFTVTTHAKRSEMKIHGDYLLLRVRDVQEVNETEYYNFVTTDHTIALPFAITHNTVWLKVRGYVPPGEVGAAKEGGGLFIIKAKLDVVFGCYPEHQLILTDEGVKQVKEITTKDTILAMHSEQQPLHVMSRCYVGELIRVTPYMSPPFEVTPEHPILVLPKERDHGRLKTEVNERKFKWIRAGELTKDYWVVLPRISESKTLYFSYGSDRNIEIDTDLAWLIGLFIGDGYASHSSRQVSFYLASSEMEYARRISEIVYNKFGLKSRIKTHQGKIIVTINSRLLRDEFLKFYNKHGKKRIPFDYIYMKPEVIKSFIQGLWCADGQKTQKKCYGIVMTSEDVMYILPLLFAKIGVGVRWAYGNRRKQYPMYVEWSKSHFNIETLEIQPLKQTRYIYNDKFFCCSIKNIERVHYQGRVYNFETSDNTINMPIITHNSQKSYFHEYFIKGGPFKDWTRFIIRGVKVPIIDPDTKKPIPGKYELMWRAMIPKDQTPYALSKRAKEKNWYPPKDVIPVPPPWKKTDEFKEWLERAKEFWKKQPKGTEKMAKKYPFVLHVITAMGPIHIRGIPNVEWHLRIKTDEGIRSWNIIGDPVRESPLAAFIEPSIDEKYFDYEGKLDPDHPINPFGFKRLEANCVIYDKGTVEYESEGTPEVIKLKFKGRLLKGEWKLTQEEKGSDIYALEKLSKHELMTKEFVLHLHEVPENSGKMHTDVRIKMNGYMEEFNLYHLEPWTVKEEEPIRAVRKKCYDVEGWFIKEGKDIRRKVGGIWTKIDVLDHGTVDIIEINPFFMSMMFHGKKLKGYYVAKKTDEGWIFMKSKLPHTELTGTGNPLTGDYYKPFKIEKKKGWNYFWVHIYDIKEFTRCVSEKEARELYLKGVNIPKQVLEVNVCLAPRKGTLPLARLQGIKVSDEWTEEQATKWIKDNALHTWSMTMIRKIKKEKSINEMVSVFDDGEGCEKCL